MRRMISAVIAALLAAVIMCGCAGGASGANTVKAVLPDQSYSGSLQHFIESSDYSKWIDYRRDHVETSRELQPDIMPFYADLMKEILGGTHENAVCSPVNVYIALSMLAEAASGQTRQQILDVLRAADIRTLRSTVKNVWNANYSDNPAIKCQLANSIWIRDDTKYNGDLLKTLAGEYYADSFVGDFSSDSLSSQLGKWTDDHTGGLLKDYTKEMKLDPAGIMELVSAIYFKGTWVIPFSKDATEKQTFHGENGDSECDMMVNSGAGEYYWGEHFSAVTLPINMGGSMIFFLPDEGTDPAGLARDPEVHDVILNVMNYEYENRKELIINKRIPKFSISAKTDLKDILAAIGITDAFDPKAADFSELAEFPDEIWVDKAEHAAMVEIDEEGVTGAAYTDLALAGGAMPPTETVDFVLDRPFMYAVTGSDGTLLFAGTVYDLQ